MKKILLAVIMVLCFTVPAFAWGDFTSVNMSQCQMSILGMQQSNISVFTTGGSNIAAGALQAQGGLFITERYGWCGSSTFAASGQLQAQGVVITPVREHHHCGGRPSSSATATGARLHLSSRPSTRSMSWGS